MPVLFLVDLDYRPLRADDCSVLHTPISQYLTTRCALGPTSDLWFSRPEIDNRPNYGQDVVIDGGVRAGTTALRFTCEIHQRFCHCAHCLQEPDWHLWSYAL